MADRPVDQPDKKPSNDADALQSLQNEIRLHQKKDKSRSVLERGVGAVYDLFHKDEQSADSLQALYKDAETKLKSGDAKTVAETKEKIDAAVKKDREELTTRESVTHYGAGFAKTAALFMRGEPALAGTIAIYAADQWNPNESWKNQLADAGLGGLKGAGMKGLFKVMGDMPQAPMVKGIALGIGNSTLDVALTRNSYQMQDGSLSFGKGLGKTLSSALDIKARAIDGAVFVAADGLFQGGNALTRGAIKNSPFASTVFTGATFGLSTGGVGEYMRQKDSGEQLDLKKIVQHAAVQGLLDSAAASFGGIQADRGLRMQMSGRVDRLSSNLSRRVDALKSQAGNMADMMMGGGPQLALAGVPGGYFEPARAVEPVRVEKITPAPEIPQVLEMSAGGGRGGMYDGPRMPAEKKVVKEPERPQGPPVVSLTVPDGLVEVAKNLNELSKQLCETPEDAGMKEQVVQFLKENPGLQQFALELARARNNPVLTEAVQEGAVREDGLVGKMYSTPSGDKSTYRLWAELRDDYMPGLKLEKHAEGYQQAVRTYLNLYPELRSAADFHARNSTDLRLVEALDPVLGTNYAQALKPAVEADGAGKVEAVDEHPAGNDPAADALKVRALTNPLATGDVGQATPGDTSASTLHPTSQEAILALHAKRLASEDPMERAQVAEELAAHVDKLLPPDFDRWVQASPADVLARGLDSTNSSRVRKTVNALANRLGELSDESFVRWKAAAQEKILDGYVLQNPAIDSLPLELQKAFLAKNPSPEEIRRQKLKDTPPDPADTRSTAQKLAPDWAGDYIAESQKLMDEQKAKAEAQGRRWNKPWKPSFLDTIDSRLELLARTAEAFEKAPAELTPGLKERLLRLGAHDKAGLTGVLDAVGYRETERGSKQYSWVEGDPRVDANRKLLAQLLPQARSMEPVTYLYQFLRERNANGAYAAAQEMKPPTIPSKTLAEVKDELQRAKIAAGETVDEGKLVLEAMQKLGESTRSAESQWTDIRKLLSDLANGRIQAPRRNGPGGRFGDRNKQPVDKQAVAAPDASNGSGDQDSSKAAAAVAAKPETLDGGEQGSPQGPAAVEAKQETPAGQDQLKSGAERVEPQKVEPTAADPFAGVETLRLETKHVKQLRDYAQQLQSRLSEGQIKKMWRRDDPITGITGIKGVTFRQVCKMLNWVPDGVFD